MEKQFITKLEEIQEKGVYRFHYLDEVIKQNSFDSLHHCFDGILIPKKQNKNFIFYDTYWGGGEAKFRTFEDLLIKGNITLICNMDEVETIQEHEIKYFKSEDIFDLSRQHGCYKRFFRNKDAKKDEEVILKLIEERQIEINRKIQLLEDEHKRLDTLKYNIPVLENLDNVWL